LRQSRTFHTLANGPKSGVQFRDLLGEEGLFKQLKKALIERALGAELTEHLGYEKGDPAGRGRGDNRNGVSSKDGFDG
jgi:transposase-like protein